MSASIFKFGSRRQHRLPLILGMLLLGELTAWAGQGQNPAQNHLPFADQFAKRGQLGGPSGDGRINNSRATEEAGEPRHAGVYAETSVWASWTAPETGLLTMKAAGQGFPVVIAAYANGLDLDAAANSKSAGTAIDDSLQEVAAAVPKKTEDRFASEITFPVHAGVQYEIAVAGLGSASGNIQFAWQLKDTPQALPVVRGLKSRKMGARSEGMELSCEVQSRTTLQYQWLHNGDPLPGKSSTSLILPELTDSDVGTYQLRITLPAESPQSEPIVIKTSEIDIQIASGDQPDALAANSFAALLAQFEEQAKDKSGGSGVPKPRRNGSKADLPALPVIGLTRSYSGSQIFSTVYAMSDPGEPQHCNVYGGASYWYGYTASASGTLAFDTEGSNYDTILAIYTYNPAIGGYAGLNSITCANDQSAANRTSRVTFSAQGGVQYIVVVDGVNRSRGTVRLNWQFIPLAPQIVSQPASVTINPGQSATFNVAATSSAAVSYQWRVGGITIPGATNPTLTVNAATAANAARYDVLVRNAGGTVFSVPATLTVLVPPPATLPPPQSVKATMALFADGAGISCATDAGRTYQLQCRSNNNWKTLQTRTGNGGILTFIESSNDTSRFFRIVAVQ